MIAGRAFLLAALAAMSLCAACGDSSDPDDQGDDGSGGADADGGGGTCPTGGQPATGGANASGGAGTGGAASGAGGEGDGGSSPGACPETELEFTFDSESPQDDLAVTATPSSLLFQTAVPTPGTPNFSLSILGIDYAESAPLTIDLGDGPRIDWSLGSNGSGIPSAIVSTMPSGGNQLPGDFAGTLILVRVGAAVDDTRCGTIDLSVEYVDEDETPHTFTAEGSFQTVLSPAEMP
jgi:hypothetical protein